MPKHPDRTQDEVLRTDLRALADGSLRYWGMLWTEVRKRFGPSRFGTVDSRPQGFLAWLLEHPGELDRIVEAPAGRVGAYVTAACRRYAAQEEKREKPQVATSGVRRLDPLDRDILARRARGESFAAIAIALRMPRATVFDHFRRATAQ